jgi:hypothetical protein
VGDIVALKFHIHSHQLIPKAPRLKDLKFYYSKIDFWHSDHLPKWELCLQLKSSIVSATTRARPADLWTPARSTSLLPIRTQILVASTEIRGW